MTLAPAPVTRAASRGSPQAFLSLDAASTPGPGNEYNLLEAFGLYTVQADAAAVIRVEGSLTGLAWATLGDLTFSGSGIQSMGGSPVTYVRLNLLSGGPVTAWVAATNAAVDAAVSVGSVTVTAESDHTEDDPAGDAAVGSYVLGVRNDSAAVRTSADGDYGSVALDSAGRVGVTALGGTLPVSLGSAVALDATTLAALETINAIVSGTVALDSSTLAALETINAVVSGTVAVSNPTDVSALATQTTLAAVLAKLTAGIPLDTATLAALETINAVVSGTVAVSSLPTAVVVDANNSTTTPLGAGATFTGTATDISAYQQVNIEIYGRPSAIQGDGSTAKGTFFFEFSPDGTNWDVSVPSLVRDPGLVIPTPVINVGKWFRVRYINDGGALAISIFGLSDTAGTPTAQTSFRLVTQLLPLATKELTRTLDQSISGSDPVGLTRSISSGSNPDGMYINVAAGGTKTLSPATSLLGVGGVYTSSWMDTENYPTIKLLVTSDQVSADNGIALQWSDTSTGTSVRTTESHSFRSGYIANGRLIVTATRARYLRIVYTNGTVAQTRFFLNLRLNPVPVVAEVSLTPSATGTTGQQTVTLVATALAGTGTAGRDAFRLKNMSTSARPLFYGFASSLTTANGDELAAGESVELDIDETVTIYVITTSTGGAGVACSWLEIA